MTKRLTILLVFSLLVAVFASAFLLLKEKPKKEQPSHLFSTTTPTAVTTTQKVKPYQPVLVPTDDWQVYRNDRYEFELKYPPKWLLETDELYTAIFPSEYQTAQSFHPSIIVNVEPNPQNLNIREFFAQTNKPNWFSHSNNEYTEGLIAGKSYYRFVPYATFAGEVDVVICLNSAFLEIIDLGAAFQDGIFDTILSTLMFE